MPHGFAKGEGLGIEGALGQEVPGVGDVMIFAPGADAVAVVGAEALRYVLVIAVAPRGGQILLLPQKLRQDVGDENAPLRMEGCVQLLGEDQRRALGVRGGHAVFALHVRLVRKDRGHRFADVPFERPCIGGVGDLQKAVDRLGAEHVHIAFTVEPGALRPQFDVGPVSPGGILAIAAQISVFELDIVSAEEIAARLFSGANPAVKLI